MNIILSMPGKLLCNMGYHSLVTKVRPHKTVVSYFFEERVCTRCGFSFPTGARIEVETFSAGEP